MTLLGDVSSLNLSCEVQYTFLLDLRFNGLVTRLGFLIGQVENRQLHDLSQVGIATRDIEK
jgi:hypothetical protein